MTGYPTLGADIWPTFPTKPAPANGSVSVHSAAELEDFFNGTGGAASGGHTIIVTADITSAVQLVGHDNIVILNPGVVVEKVILCNVSGGADDNAFCGPGGIGSIECAAHGATTDLTLRGVTIAPDLAATPEDTGAVSIVSSVGSARILIVNSVIAGHDAAGADQQALPLVFGDTDDIVIANSNVAAGDAGVTDNSWGLRCARCNHVLMVDVWVKARQNKVTRFGDGTYSYFLWTSSDDHNADVRRSTAINPDQCYLSTDINGAIVSDAQIVTRQSVYCGDATAAHFYIGGNPSSGVQSSLYLLSDLDFLSEGAYVSGAGLTSLEAMAAPGEQWVYDVGSLNSFGATSTDPLTMPTPPDICSYLDPGDSLCPPQSDPDQIGDDNGIIFANGFELS